MFVKITNENQYIRNVNVSDYEIDDNFDIDKKLFNTNIKVKNDPWMWHLHLKITNECNSNCNFCIEKSPDNKENNKLYLNVINKILNEMQNNNILYSVSLTGGEPLLFKYIDKLIDILSRYNIKFLTMNTNGSLINKHIGKIDQYFDFLNISRHSPNSFENNKIFCNQMPTLCEILNLKSKLKKSKIRLQCVILKDYKNYLPYINLLEIVDEISFRGLINPGEYHNIKYDNRKSMENYFNLLNYIRNKTKFKLEEQVIQDYYVYETYTLNNKRVCFSYSDMDMLTKAESKEDDKIFREFILHPDCIFTGSWNKNKKIIEVF